MSLLFRWPDIIVEKIVAFLSTTDNFNVGLTCRQACTKYWWGQQRELCFTGKHRMNPASFRVLHKITLRKCILAAELEDPLCQIHTLRTLHCFSSIVRTPYKKLAANCPHLRDILFDHAHTEYRFYREWTSLLALPRLERLVLVDPTFDMDSREDTLAQTDAPRKLVGLALPAFSSLLHLTLDSLHLPERACFPKLRSMTLIHVKINEAQLLTCTSLTNLRLSRTTDVYRERYDDLPFAAILQLTTLTSLVLPRCPANLDLTQLSRLSQLTRLGFQHDEYNTPILIRGFDNITRDLTTQHQEVYRHSILQFKCFKYCTCCWQSLSHLSRYSWKEIADLIVCYQRD